MFTGKYKDLDCIQQAMTTQVAVAIIILKPIEINVSCETLHYKYRPIVSISGLPQFHGNKIP